jgi:hypothetical protein
MTLKDFENKYAIKGGMQKLTELRSLYFTNRYIAYHFGVSQQSVVNWMLQFFGSRYDPREDRKEAIIANMVEFAKNNPLIDFKYAFKGTEWYKEALERINKLKLYDTQ